MSFSLELKHGDLALNGTSLGTVTDAAKLQQDLICDILTPLGFDELHPDFGSTLEDNLAGNVNIPGVIGTKDFQRAATITHAELLRICQNYQAQQIARNENDSVKFGRYTLSPGEILIRVVNVAFTQVEDRLIAKLTLEVGNNTIEIHTPLPSPAV